MEALPFVYLIAQLIGNFKGIAQREPIVTYMSALDQMGQQGPSPQGNNQLVLLLLQLLQEKNNPRSMPFAQDRFQRGEFDQLLQALLKTDSLEEAQFIKWKQKMREKRQLRRLKRAQARERA